MYEQIFASMLEVAINSQFFITGGIFSAFVLVIALFSFRK